MFILPIIVQVHIHVSACIQPCVLKPEDGGHELKCVITIMHQFKPQPRLPQAIIYFSCRFRILLEVYMYMYGAYM